MTAVKIKTKEFLKQNKYIISKKRGFGCPDVKSWFCFQEVKAILKHRDSV